MVTYSVEVLGWRTEKWHAVLEGQAFGFSIGYVAASPNRENMRIVRSDGVVAVRAGGVSPGGRITRNPGSSEVVW